MADPADITPQLTTDAQRPRRARTETAEVERHSLPDQIAAAKFLLGQAARLQPKKGIQFSKFIPPTINGQVTGGAGSGAIDGGTFY
jgi:hypothetical protein